MKKANIPNWFYYSVIVYAGIAAGIVGYIAYGDGGMPLRYPIGLAVICYIIVVVVSLLFAKYLFEAMDDF